MDFDDEHPLFKQPRGGGSLPYAVSVMIALEEGTTWTVKRAGEVGEDAKEITIPRLGAVVFRGDLPHAGSAYNERNVRFHVYYAVRGDTDDTRMIPPRDGWHLAVINCHDLFL